MSTPPGRDALEAWLTERDERLAAEQWKLLEEFLARVESHNAKVNLTADSGAALYVRHAADAFPALAVLRKRFSAPPTILDVGAGAGFVGVTIKIAWPEADVSLLESSYRKFGFLNWACAETKLRGLHALLGRAPQGLRGKTYDAVLLRAVTQPEEAVRLGLSCARRDGGIVLLHLSERPELQPKIAKAIETAGARLGQVEPYRLPGEGADRFIVVLEN